MKDFTNHYNPAGDRGSLCIDLFDIENAGYTGIGKPASNIIKALAFILILIFGNMQIFAQSGTAPIDPPTGGFSIEGDLLANTPTANIGDWVQNSGGTGGGVLTTAGIPLNSTITRRVYDVYNTNSDTIFTGGDKFNASPATWGWTTSKSTGKDDINNALIHFAYDASGNVWFIFAGDRMDVTGTSYIDFEILQNTLTLNSSNGFTSEGPNLGRTVGDILITVQYSNGGTNPVVYTYQWQATPGGKQTYDYVQITPASGTVYAATNLSGTVSVPYGAFGSATYPTYAFAEAAANLNKLFGAAYQVCIGIKTIMIKTKTSTAESATLKDLIKPIQVNLATKPEATMTGSTVCYGSTATLTPVITQGKGPYSYLWSTTPPQTTSSITVTGLSTSTYYVTITGSNSCMSDPISATVTVNALPGISMGKTNVNCYGGNDGTATASVSGGLTPYSYSWNNGQTALTATGLTAGTYTVTVTDGRYCQNTATINVAQPAALSVSMSADPNPVLCTGSSATITVSASGGTTAYQYSLNGGSYQSSNTFTRTAGTYTVTVKDANNCTQTATLQINNASTLNAGTTQTNISCNGANNGSATVTVSGGAGGYSYLWSNAYTSATINNLSTGTYTVTVTDANNCTITKTVAITQPDALSAWISGKSDVTHFGGNDGSATAGASGGTTVYNYLWNNGQTAATATGLTAGNYTVTVTDAHSCTATASTQITQPVYLCLKAKVLLQGPYNLTTHLMRDDLRAQRVIPRVEPYSSAPYNTRFTHTGGGGGESIAIADTAAVFADHAGNSIVDWVFVELRDKNDYTHVVRTKSALVQRDGDVVDVDGVSSLLFYNMTDNQYYVAIRHRNHLGVMTASAKTLSQECTVVDFTKGGEPEFNWGTGCPSAPGKDFTGLSQTNPETGVRALWYGDADNNHKVKYEAPDDDQSILQSDVLWKVGNSTFQSGYDFCRGYYEGDVDLNGKVKYEAPNDDRSLILYQIIFYPLNTTHQSAYDFLIEQLP